MSGYASVVGINKYIGLGGGITGVLCLTYLFNYSTKVSYRLVFCIMFGSQFGNIF